MIKEKLKIGYFADGPWAHNAFEFLINDTDIEIMFLCVRYDTCDYKLKAFADAYGIDILKHKNINSEEFIKKIAEYNCDLFVSMSFNQIFKKKIINLPPLNTINCHAGALPFYRGRNILNWALINDEKEFGITVHYIDEGIDTGDIILQRFFPINNDDNYSSLLDKAYIGCAEILYEAIKLVQSNKARRIKQNTIHPVGFYCSQRKSGDEIINWNSSSRNIYNFIRAISKPGPMATTLLKGKEVKINKAVEIINAPKYKCIPGAVVGIDNNSLIVKTFDTVIKILEFYYNGRIKIGDRFE